MWEAVAGRSHVQSVVPEGGEGSVCPSEKWRALPAPWLTSALLCVNPLRTVTGRGLLSCAPPEGRAGWGLAPKRVRAGLALLGGVLRAAASGHGPSLSQALLR